MVQSDGHKQTDHCNDTEMPERDGRKNLSPLKNQKSRLSILFDILLTETQSHSPALPHSRYSSLDPAPNSILAQLTNWCVRKGKPLFILRPTAKVDRMIETGEKVKEKTREIKLSEDRYQIRNKVSKNDNQTMSFDSSIHPSSHLFACHPTRFSSDSVHSLVRVIRSDAVRCDWL